MAELATVVETEDQDNSDLAAGFDAESTPDKPAAKPEAEPEVKPKEPEAAATPVQTPEASEYVQVTRAQFDRLQAAADETGAIKGQMSKAFGTLGEVQQVVKRLQSATPAGVSVEIPKDAFADMEKDFPELAAQFRKGLEATLKGIKGTATVETAADPEALPKAVHAATRALQEEALSDAHPTWREIVGAAEEGKHDPNNLFRKWLATQDTAYQAKINGTNSAAVLSRSIDKFLADTKAAPVITKPAPKVVAQRERIQGAVQPKGAGGQPAPTKSADDDFQEGFRTG